jgi:hypothetical protein
LEGEKNIVMCPQNSGDPLITIQNAIDYLMPQYPASEAGRYTSLHEAVSILDACFTLVLFTTRIPTTSHATHP